MQAFLQRTAQHTLPALAALSNSRQNSPLKEPDHGSVE